MANALNFPSTPANGDIFTAATGQKWIWLASGPYWKVYTDNVTVGNSVVNSTGFIVGNSRMTSTLLTLGGGISANGTVGTAGQVLHSNGSSVYWSIDDNSGGTVTSVATGNGLTGGPITTTGTVSVLANTGVVANATGLFVNSAYIATLTANNTTYVNGKLEGALNVNSASSATTSSQLGGKLESALNVNSASSATTSSQLGGKTEANLNVNSATTATTATNSTQLNSKTEANLNVNSATTATTATNSTQLGGVAAASYQLNSTLSANVATLTANNSTYLNGQLAAFYTNATNITTGTLPYAQLGTNVVNSTANFTISGVHTHSANLVMSGATAGISANGTYGTAGQVLTSNGTTPYWSTPTVNTAAQYAWTNTHSFTSMVTHSNASASSNTDSAIWLSGSSGALTFDTYMCKRISWNDGDGNLNIRAGHYYTGTTRVYQTDGSTTSGASHIQMASDGQQGSIILQVAPAGANGATVSFSKIVTLNPSAGLTYYDGSTTSAVDAFPAGTTMLFAQTSAPTGWTKLTTHNDKALRVVSGAASSNGSVAFSTVFTSQAVSGSISSVSVTGTTDSTTAGGSISSNSATGTISSTTATGSLSSDAVSGTTASATTGISIQGATVSEAQGGIHYHFVFANTATSNGSPTLSAVQYASMDNSVGGNGSYDINGVSTVASVGRTDSSAGGGTHTHGVTDGGHSHTFTSSLHSHTFTGTAHSHTFTADLHNHTFTGTGHTHTFTSAAHSHTFTGTAINMAVAYVDVILASKN